MKVPKEKASGVRRYTSMEVRRALRQPAKFFELAARLRVQCKVPSSRSVDVRTALGELLETGEAIRWTYWMNQGAGMPVVYYWVPNVVKRLW